VISNKSLQSVCHHVARILQAEREHQELSMSLVAERAGLSQQMISYVERGLRNPTLETLLRITTALELDLSQVIAKAQKQSNTQK
jgi:transcriptional regulator with XRE-family HTH domain